MNCWAMRTSRAPEHRDFVHEELQDGRLRQGWGWEDSQDLGCLQARWGRGEELLQSQMEAARHWRMGNGDDCMKIRDLVAVLNIPSDGLFTICRITGNYYFEIPQGIEEFGHIRPVEVLTPNGVSNHHGLVHAALRRSFRCQLRMWDITAYQDSLTSIIRSGLPPEELARGSTPLERVERVVADLAEEPLKLMMTQIPDALFDRVRGEEWEPVLQRALDSLFLVSVVHTGGPQECGADLEIVIPNPFDRDRNWIVAVQVKDYEGEVHEHVAEQLENAFVSRTREGHQVIAVVLLVTNAVASEGLKARMRCLSETFHVPFVFCGRDEFLRVLARGLLRQT